jgi:SulP family sulfate permease
MAGSAKSDGTIIRKSMTTSGRFRRFFPFLLWWPLVTRKTVRDDLLAGLTGALIVLPQGVAFATIAGLPPEYGLYAAMVPAVVAALFGSSWHLVSGPTTAMPMAMVTGDPPHDGRNAAACRMRIAM